MLNFDLYTPARILFGKGEEKRIGELLKPHASKVLLHYGSGSIKKSGLYDTVTASLKESGISFAELGGVKPNPRLSLVHEGIALCKKENVDRSAVSPDRCQPCMIRSDGWRCRA